MYISCTKQRQQSLGAQNCYRAIDDTLQQREIFFLFFSSFPCSRHGVCEDRERVSDTSHSRPTSSLLVLPFPMASQVTWMGMRAEFGAWHKWNHLNQPSSDIVALRISNIYITIYILLSVTLFTGTSHTLMVEIKAWRGFPHDSEKHRKIAGRQISILLRIPVPTLPAFPCHSHDGTQVTESHGLPHHASHC